MEHSPKSQKTASVIKKVFRAVDYFLPMDLGDRSKFSQDIGRSIDRGIGLITGNPCRGCDNYYEQRNGMQRCLSPELVKVESGLCDESEGELAGLVATCLDKLPPELKGEERFKACDARWGLGQKDKLAKDFERWANQE